MIYPQTIDGRTIQSVRLNPILGRLHGLSTLLKQQALPNDPLAREALLDAALVTCVALLEGIANAILLSLSQCDRCLTKDFRLPLIEKFSLIHELKTTQKMDQKHYTIQGLNELIQNRVELIHPKPRQTTFKEFKCETIDGPRTIPIHKDPLFSSTEGDMKQIKNVFSFLDIYLIDWCKMEKDTIREVLLATKYYCFDGSIGFFKWRTGAIKEGLEAVLKIDIRFLG